MLSGDNAKNPAKDEQKLLSGNLHVWCDQGPTGYNHQEIASLTLPGLQAFAEKHWGTKGSADYAAFVKRCAPTIYLNGETVFESNNQMLCPLRWIGSKTGNSFIGGIRKLRVVNRALTHREIGRAAGLDIPENLAAGGEATASASDSAHGLIPANLTDDTPASRWSSGGTRAEQWVSLDFSKSISSNTVAITSENAVPGSYQIQASDDANHWKSVFTGDANPGRATASFPDVKARHLRVMLGKPKTQWGYSIHEIEVMRAKSERRRIPKNPDIDRPEAFRLVS